VSRPAIAAQDLGARRHGGGDPVGPHATADVPRAAPGARCGAVREALHRRRFTCAEAVVVLDADERLLGLVEVEELLAAADDAPLGGLPVGPPLVVDPDADREHVAWRAATGDWTSVAVTGPGGRFQGIVPRRELLEVLRREHEEAVRLHAGVVAGGSPARAAAEEPVRRRLRHRLPWLLLGLLGAMASALLVGAFEERLQDNVLLAIFVPAVVYMADAVGTQTEVLVIRGLSVGVDLRRVLRRELLTGGAIGLAIAAGFLPFAWVVWGDAEVAAAVALALLGSCAIATGVAMLLPWLLHRAGQDPAYGSGPVATVVQDLLSIAVYFAVAATIVPTG